MRSPQALRRRMTADSLLSLPNGMIIDSEQVIIATGRSGNDWLSRQCESLGIGRGEARLDLGLRIEMRGNQLDSLLKRSFETKLSFEGEDYSATTYCMNPQGRVVLKAARRIGYARRSKLSREGRRDSKPQLHLVYTESICNFGGG